MRNSNTVDNLRLRETIADFDSKLNSLGFNQWATSQNSGFALQTKNINNTDDVLQFLQQTINIQNQEYSQQASQKGGAAHQKPSDLFGFSSDNKATQINNLLEQAIHNQGKGSFKSRNASAYKMAISGSKEAISKLGKSLSSTSISSGGNHPQQQNSTLQKSQSLPTQNTGQKANETQSRSGHKNLKRPNPLDLKKQKSKESLRKRFLKIFTFKKTKKETQSNGTSRSSAKPIKVKDDQLSNNKSTQRNSSFASSRGNSSTISRQNSNSSNHSQSFGSIASRNQSISQSKGDSSRGNSFSSQGSLGSRSSSNSQTSKVNQSRSGPRR
jgi:hypothetical protein